MQALEPSISKQIMELHHSKHHQTYITNLNKALSDLSAAVQANDIDKQIALQPAINFNGGGHINHSLFWQNLAPASSPEASQPRESAPTLIAEITQTWGSLDAFQKAFSAKLLAIQGSGWGWLVKVEGSGDKKTLQIVTTKDQDPVPSTFVPIFGVDMWEHAYYLQVSIYRLIETQPKLPGPELLSVWKSTGLHCLTSLSTVPERQSGLRGEHLEDRQLADCGGQISRCSRRCLQGSQGFPGQLVPLNRVLQN
jgi:superoxide dismutase, Fe-Mn family